MLKAVFFDLDGTLVPMNESEFIKLYFAALTNRGEKCNRDAKKVIEVVTNSLPMMINNTTNLTNEQVFWQYYCSVFGADAIKDRYEIFDDFYRNDFQSVKPSLGDNPYARDIIDFCKSSFEIVCLTTQPVFPKQAAIYRLSTVGLREDDFSYISSYEDSINGKPNSSYFTRILDMFDLMPEEVVVIGNNVLEDALCAEGCGIKTYLIEEGLIAPPGVDDHYEHVKISEVIPLLISLLSEIK